MWTKSKNILLDLMQKFKYIEIPLDLASEIDDTHEDLNETPASAEEIDFDLARNNRQKSSFVPSKTMMFGRLLTEQDIIRVRDKFQEDIDNVLEEAIRKHVSIF